MIPMMEFVVETFSYRDNDNGERELAKTSSKPCFTYGEAVAVYDLTLKSSLDVRVELKRLMADRSGYYSLKAESPCKWRFDNEVKLSHEAMFKAGQQTLC